MAEEHVHEEFEQEDPNLEDIQDTDVESEEELESDIPDPESLEEQRASENGWMPYEDWVQSGKDPNDWRDAKTFNERGEFMGVITRQNKKIQEMQKAMDQFKDFYRKVEQKAQENARKELLKQKKEAMEEHDYDKVLEIDEELKNTDQQDDPFEDDDSSSEGEYFNEWVSQNQWYNEDVEMQSMADAFGIAYARQNPNASTEEVFKHVDKKIREHFPEKFGMKSRRTNQVASSSNSSKPSRSRGGSLVGKLSDEQKQVGQRFVRTGLFDNLEAYAKELKELGEL